MPEGSIIITIRTLLGFRAQLVFPHVAPWWLAQLGGTHRAFVVHHVHLRSMLDNCYCWQDYQCRVCCLCGLRTCVVGAVPSTPPSSWDGFPDTAVYRYPHICTFIYIYSPLFIFISTYIYIYYCAYVYRHVYIKIYMYIYIYIYILKKRLVAYMGMRLHIKTLK